MVRRFGLLFLVVAALAISACTKYQPDSLAGGFSEIPLSNNAYRIETRGNSFASAALVREITLVRGAVLTLDNGFQRFVVLDQADWENISTTVLPGTYQSNSTVHGSMIGGNIYGSGSTFGTYTPPQTIQHSKPSNAMVIYMVREGEPGYEQALDPMQIIRTFGARVGYEGQYLG
ncbi:CC0125/CC1285 family lipoprotein [Microbaculum sp. FT89]|uniref:CC0125/CC1285 family lipoprotein n=1 Tax=Microbaculum sp. FT89 TaxID=3447298 RepID=UPI003F537418